MITNEMLQRRDEMRVSVSSDRNKVEGFIGGEKSAKGAATRGGSRWFVLNESIDPYTTQAQTLKKKELA